MKIEVIAVLKPISRVWVQLDMDNCVASRSRGVVDTQKLAPLGNNELGGSAAPPPDTGNPFDDGIRNIYELERDFDLRPAADKEDVADRWLVQDGRGHAGIELKQSCSRRRSKGYNR